MTAHKNFYNALKDDPKAILKWCDDEIEEYKKLKKLIKKNDKPNTKKFKTIA